MPVTFQPLARQTIDPVRRTSITSVLLILVFATSASACVAEWGSQPATSCPHSSTRRVCVREKPGTAMAFGLCGHVLKSVPGKCGLRSFVQFQFVAFHKFEISAPLRRVAGNISAPFDSAIIVSSIGSPETDRGPPRS
jgi:hypothetical protein